MTRAIVFLLFVISFCIFSGCTDPEKAAFGKQLGDVLAYMEKLKSLNVEGVEPTMHGHGRVNAFREDVVTPSLDREAALANAPERTGDEFRLPKIVEDA